MNMPGFNAEISLYRSSDSYHSAHDASTSDGYGKIIPNSAMCEAKCDAFAGAIVSSCAHPVCVGMSYALRYSCRKDCNYSPSGSGGTSEIGGYYRGGLNPRTTKLV